MHFKEWLLRQNATPYTANRYVGAVYSVIPEWAKELGWDTNLISTDDVVEVERSVDFIKQQLEFIKKNNAGNRMYSSALNKFVQYKKALLNDEPVEVQDVIKIQRDESISDTEKKTLIKARVGQGRYRDELIRIWRGKCAVTGYPDSRMLIASHIKPWFKANNQERLDPYNGLLLTPNLDKVFDSGFISFDNKGKILFSPNIVKPEGLGLSEKMKLTNVSPTTEEYMKFHRDNVFVK